MRKTIKIETHNYQNDTWGYSGYDENNNRLFSNSFEDTSEGIAEFTGAVHALMYIKKNQLMGDVYVKNQYIKECIEKKEYKHSPKGEKAATFLKRCKIWLVEQKSNINIFVTPETKPEEENYQEEDDKFMERKTWFNRD